MLNKRGFLTGQEVEDLLSGKSWFMDEKREEVIKRGGNIMNAFQKANSNIKYDRLQQYANYLIREYLVKHNEGKPTEIWEVPWENISRCEKEEFLAFYKEYKDGIDLGESISESKDYDHIMELFFLSLKKGLNENAQDLANAMKKAAVDYYSSDLRDFLNQQLRWREEDYQASLGRYLGRDSHTGEAEWMRA